MAAGAGHGLALKADGTVWAWGSNSFRSTGRRNAHSARLTATQVNGLGQTVRHQSPGGAFTVSGAKRVMEPSGPGGITILVSWAMEPRSAA